MFMLGSVGVNYIVPKLALLPIHGLLKIRDK